MKVLVSGSHGLIGTSLIARLTAAGHAVTRLIRGPSASGEISWDPVGGTIDAQACEGHDAVVHLAGAGIGDHRWTSRYKAELRDSRVRGTDLLVRTLASLDRPPEVLASGSAIGFYGDRGDEDLDEASAPGSGFLSELVQEWEGAANPASAGGIRLVLLRTGVVLASQGGALKKQLLPFKLGLGGRIGSGQQYLSWISIDDETRAIVALMGDRSVSGPVNLTSPNPVTNREFTRALARVLRRPAVVPVPRPALELLLGKEMVAEVLLAGQRALPRTLQDTNFDFNDPSLEAALRRLLVA